MKHTEPHFWWKAAQYLGGGGLLVAGSGLLVQVIINWSSLPLSQSLLQATGGLSGIGFGLMLLMRVKQPQ